MANRLPGRRGQAPAGNRERFGIEVGTTALDQSHCCARTSARPGLAVTEKCLCNVPRRKSASTSSTRDPACASVIAKLADTIDLPSCALALVMTMLRG